MVPGTESLQCPNCGYTQEKKSRGTMPQIRMSNVSAEFEFEDAECLLIRDQLLNRLPTLPAAGSRKLLPLLGTLEDAERTDAA